MREIAEQRGLKKEKKTKWISDNIKTTLITIEIALTFIPRPSVCRLGWCLHRLWVGKEERGQSIRSWLPGRDGG